MIYELTAAEGRVEDLKAAFVANLPVTAAYEGNELTTLSQSQESPDDLRLVLRWGSLEQFKAYRAWRVESGSSALTPDLLAQPPVITVYDTVFG